MGFMLIVVGILSAAVTGGLTLFTLGEIPAAIVAVVILALSIYGVLAARAVARLILALSMLALVGSLGFGGFSAFQLYQALSETSGPTDLPDAATLARADAKIEAADDLGGFHIELFEDELTALFLDELAGNADSPLKGVALTVIDGDDGERGTIEFEATFKGGGVTAQGTITASIEFGGMQIEILDAGLGNFNLPGIATGAVEDLIETVTDLNERLAEAQADIQALDIGGGRVLIVGTQGDGDLLTSIDLLNALRENAASLGAATTPPAERFGPGVVNSTQADGARYYVALGDSLAANVGVAQASDGYVSRFHNQLQIRDGASYGLRNFGVSGETSGTLVRGGQLEAALDFIRDNDIAYLTIDIGANDLLGHLGSADCSNDLNAAGCRERLDNTLASYRPNIERIFDALREAGGGDATIIFLTAYNPFSLGFGAAVGLEAETTNIVRQLNAVAVAVASEHDVLVADGLAAMLNTAAATTHMLDAPPDIHPRAIGYDLLTGALLDALP